MFVLSSGSGRTYSLRLGDGYTRLEKTTHHQMRASGPSRLTIETKTGRGGCHRRKRSCLLALVGLGTEQGVSRDRVLALLWPESDTDRARNNLKQTLFQLRQDLHEEVFARGAGALRLEPSAISVDACDFQAALDRDNPTTAVTLYRGPFLDGFYLPGLAEFERWWSPSGSVWSSAMPAHSRPWR